MEFVRALLSDYLNRDVEDANFVYLDDGKNTGINAFHLEVVDADEDSDGPSTRMQAQIVRYLLPTDFETESHAALREMKKIRETLKEAPSQGDLAPLLDFWRHHEVGSRLTVLFVSANQLPDIERDAVDQASAVLSVNAPVEASAEHISLHTIYLRDHVDHSVQVPLQMQVPVAPGATFVSGATTLLDLHEFLKHFAAERGDLNALYDKNVRVFLGKTKINKGIARTLKEEPQNFGLYNNGITIVTRNITPLPEGGIMLTDPSVVNGCQTTRTLHDTLRDQFRTPTASQDTAWREWRSKIDRGYIVIKVVRVAPGEEEGDELLESITRYTNSQTAVNEKDFVALNSDFRRWKRELAQQGIFLEILRNESTAQKARQKEPKYTGTVYSDYAKAFPLLKVYGAGWMNEPGAAWNNNNAFVPPSGKIFKNIVAHDNEFSSDDILAALYLQEAADKQKFGKQAPKNADETAVQISVGRRLTRHLFYRTMIELMRRLLKHRGLSTSRPACTKAILALRNSQQEWRVFVDHATDVIDAYMRASGDYSIYKEPSYSGNFNAFLKKENFAKEQADHPNLWILWNIRETLMQHDPLLGNVQDILQMALKTK